MKRQLILLTLACAVALTACSKSESVNDGQTASETQSVTESVTKSVTESVTESITESTAETTAAETESTETDESTDSADEEGGIPKEDYPDYLYGPGMDKISVDEITDISYGTGNKWDYAACDGFTYLAEPNGITYNSIDNADIYNGDLAFNGVPEAPASEYKRYKVGDTVCGLTISEASVSFSYFLGAGQDDEQRYFQGGMAIFDGSAELTGHLVILGDYEYAVGGNGDAVLILDSDGQVLPVLNYDAYSPEKGVYSTHPNHCFIVGGVTFQSEYPFVFCGNVKDYDSELFEDIEWNTPTRVKLTAENIMMNSSIDWFANINVTVTDLEILD